MEAHHYCHQINEGFAQCVLFDGNSAKDNMEGVKHIVSTALLLMKKKMNSYGKTWHVCQSGGIGAPGDQLPLGEPMLAWSFHRDREAMPGMVEARDKNFGVRTA